MDRPSRGPRRPVDDGGNGSGRDAPHRSAIPDPWADALHALQSVAPPASTRTPPPSQLPQPSTAASQEDLPPARIDEAMEALQALASRHRTGAGQALATSSAAAGGHDDPFPRRDVRTPPPRTAAFDPTAPDPVSEPEWLEDADPPARRGTRWGSPVLIIVSSAVLAVLLVGALGLSRQWFHRESTEPPQPAQETAASRPATSAAAPVLVRMPNADGRADLATIEKAMSDCDDEAARQQDGLFFVILPLLSPIKNYQPWVAVSVGEIGTSVILLRSKDALDGLRDGSLTLYRGAYSFSIIDATTEATHTWTPATGVAKFAKPDAAQIAGFRVRFGFADFVGDTPSNFRFPRQKGICYWVSALLRE